MIRITIERITVVKYNETKSFVTEEHPTQVSERGYGNETKPAYERKYETRDVPMQRTETDLILKQEIENDANFDTVAVIKAINKIYPETAARMGSAI